MAANYGDDDTVGVYGGDIEAQLEQMRINTIENLRKFYAVDGDDASVQDEAAAQSQAATQKQSLSDAETTVAPVNAVELGIIANARRQSSAPLEQ